MYVCASVGRLKVRGSKDRVDCLTPVTGGIYSVFVHLSVCARVTSTSSWRGLWASRACVSWLATGDIHIVYICMCFSVMDLHPDQLVEE